MGRDGVGVEVGLAKGMAMVGAAKEATGRVSGGVCGVGVACCMLLAVPAFRVECYECCLHGHRPAIHLPLGLHAAPPLLQGMRRAGERIEKEGRETKRWVLAGPGGGFASKVRFWQPAAPT